MEIQLEDAPETIDDVASDKAEFSPHSYEEEEEDEELDDVDEEIAEDERDGVPVVQSKRVLVIPPAIPKKRSSIHIDEDAQGSDEERREWSRGQTPPKRVRIEGKYSGATRDEVEMSPRRKRSSEELEDDLDGLYVDPPVRMKKSSKRAKMGPEDDAASVSSVATSPPQTSTPAAGDSEEELVPVEIGPGTDVDDERSTPRSRRNRGTVVAAPPAATARRERVVADV